jgi:hypothetical protein
MALPVTLVMYRVVKTAATQNESRTWSLEKMKSARVGVCDGGGFGGGGGLGRAALVLFGLRGDPAVKAVFVRLRDVTRREEGGDAGRDVGGSLRTKTWCGMSSHSSLDRDSLDRDCTDDVVWAAAFLGETARGCLSVIWVMTAD